jgi:hypothetical protein
LGDEDNWKMELLDLINKKFGCKATDIIFLWTYKNKYQEYNPWWDFLLKNNKINL